MNICFIATHKYGPQIIEISFLAKKCRFCLIIWKSKNVKIDHILQLFYSFYKSNMKHHIKKWRSVFHFSKSIWTQNDKNLICHKKYRFCQIIWKSRKSKNKSQLLLFYSFCKSNMNKNIKKRWIFPSFCNRNMDPKTQNLQKLILPKKWTQNWELLNSEQFTKNKVPKMKISQHKYALIFNILVSTQCVHFCQMCSKK